MSTLFIGPSVHNDHVTNAVFVERLAASADDIPLVPLYDERESHLLKGEWPGRSYFFNHCLPVMRQQICSALENKAITTIHVDLGDELATLYAAYYAVVDQGLPVRVTVHHGDKIGGSSKVAQFAPLLLRKIALVVLSRAEHVFVTDREDAAHLFQRYPRLQRDILGAPHKASKAIEAAPAAASLSSS